MTKPVIRFLVSATVLLVVGISAWALSRDTANRALVFSLLTGVALGVVFQRSRFCFLCNLRDFLEKRDPLGVFAILAALATGTVLYTVIVMAWMPIPQIDRLPPNAHIGPVGLVLAIGSFVFGLGMAISGSCLSAHIYRLGEGSPTSPFALIGAATGFLIGFKTWNPLYLWSVSESRAIWLPHSIGYAGTVAATLLVLAVVFILVFRFGSWTPQHGIEPNLSSLFKSVFQDRWPALTGGVAVGVISAFYFLRVAPLGVTAELGSLVRTEASALGIIPETLLGLDGLRGCATVVKEAVLSNNGLLVVGIFSGSLAAAIVAGQFRPSIPTVGQIVRGTTGGVLLGWGAMVSLGCTIGVLLSGIHAGALSGWMFLVFCVLGTTIGLKLMRQFQPQH